MTAGRAPLGPEIDQDRLLAGGINDIGLEVFTIYIEGVLAVFLVAVEMHLGSVPDGLLLDIDKV